jgi:hypothetical protein
MPSPTILGQAISGASVGDELLFMTSAGVTGAGGPWNTEGEGKGEKKVELMGVTGDEAAES